jgi:hypothetical protein
MFPWINLITLIPGIIAGIEHIHGDAKSGADKKQLALEALGLAGNTAAQAIPGEQLLIESAKTIASQAIDLSVSAFNAFGWPKHQLLQVGQTRRIG